MKALILATGILLAGSLSSATSVDTVGCYSAVLDEARKVFGPFQESQSIYPLQYEGSKVVIYGSHLEKNGGRIGIEAAVEKETWVLPN